MKRGENRIESGIYIFYMYTLCRLKKLDDDFNSFHDGNLFVFVVFYIYKINNNE